jgi:hypothetical protein
VIDRCGQTWNLGGTLYLVLSSAGVMHQALDLEGGRTHELWELQDHVWGESGHCRSMKRIA